MRRIRIPNPRLQGSERTFLDADYTSGTALTVVSDLGFADNDWAIIGEIGEEKTEMRDVTSVTGNTVINVSTDYKFSHNKSTSIYRSEWDQIVLERKLHTSTTWVVISTMNIQWDKLDTIYVDATGDATYDYRFHFYNSQSVNYSEYSPTVSGSGFTRNQVGTMILNVRRKIKDPNRQRFTDTEIMYKLQDGQIYIPTILQELWFLKVDSFEASNGIAASAGTSKYSLSPYTDLNYVSSIKYKFVNGGNTFLWDLERKSETEYDMFVYNQTRINADDVARFKFLPPDSSSTKGYFTVDPVPLTSGVGTFYPVYYRYMNPLTSIEDTTELSFPEILEDFAAWRLHELMGNEGEAAKYQTLFFGPSFIPSRARGVSNQLTGITLLEVENKSRNQAVGVGRSLSRFRGRRGINNYNRRRDLINRDYYKEHYF